MLEPPKVPYGCPPVLPPNASAAPELGSYPALRSFILATVPPTHHLPTLEPSQS